MIMQVPFSKKIDNAGRVSIPSKLRFLLGLMVGDCTDFYIMVDSKSKVYLGIECKRAIPAVVETVQTAIQNGEFEE